MLPIIVNWYFYKKEEIRQKDTLYLVAKTMHVYYLSASKGQKYRINVNVCSIECLTWMKVLKAKGRDIIKFGLWYLSIAHGWWWD